MKLINASEKPGAQRLSVGQLQAYERLGLGMFISFGMSTYDGNEFSPGDKPSTFYAPDKLDVDQWVGVARDIGAKYAVLTAKHVSGHCLWPTALNDYNVRTSSNTTDVVEAFVGACERKGVLPGLYYCSWDNHNTFGSLTPPMSDWNLFYTTREYEDFHWGQTEELLSRYGKIAEFWLDIPHALSKGFRHALYWRMASLQPEMVIVANHGQAVQPYPSHIGWPCDAMTYERHLPGMITAVGPSDRTHQPWLDILGKEYYVPGESCETISHSWFHDDAASLRPLEELLGFYLLSRSRKVNFLLNIPPDRHGLIPPAVVDHALNLRRAIARVDL